MTRYVIKKEPETVYRIRANFDPIKHPRDPRTGKFVERPYPVPDEISGLDTKQIIGELAATNDNFDEMVEGIAVDMPSDDDGPNVPTEIKELVDDPSAGSGGSIDDIEPLEYDDISEGDRIRVNGQKATVRGKSDRFLSEKVKYKPDNGAESSANPDRDTITTIGPDADGMSRFGESGQWATADSLLQTEYGPKVGFDTPYEAKDVIKGTDFDETHRSWDSDKELWTVDLDSVEQVRDKLVDAGYRVRISNDILEVAN